MNDWELAVYMVGAFIAGFMASRALKSLAKANKTLEEIRDEMRYIRKEGTSEDQSDSESR